MKKTIINVQTGEQLEVDCKPYRNSGWVVLLLADFEEIPEGFFEFDPATDLRPDPAGEAEWAAAEMAVVADQLLKIEDGDPTALPGTDRQWRDYRIALRSWKDGAEHFPDQQYRPQRPA